MGVSSCLLRPAARERLTGSTDASAQGTTVVNRQTKAVDWRQVLEIQNAYLRASMERAVRFNRSYLETSQALVTSAVSTVRRQADKAA
jgi:hypothetical protein